MWGRKAAALAMTSVALTTVFVTFNVQEASAPAEPVVVQEPFVFTGPSDQHVIDVAMNDYNQQLIAFFAEQKAKQEAKPAPVAKPAPAVRPEPATDSSDTSRWDRLAQCESGGNWAYPPVSGGFSGGIMFHIGTWLANGGGEYAPDSYLATREQQIIVAERLLARSGWGQWPGCSRKFGWL